MGAEMGETDTARKHTFASGRVQGIGSRYRIYYLVEGLGLTGWARNPYDECVEMELQGHEEGMNRLPRKLQENTFIHIEHCEAERVPVTEERGFHVRGQEKSLENRYRVLEAFSLPRIQCRSQDLSPYGIVINGFRAYLVCYSDRPAGVISNVDSSSICFFV